MIIEFAGLPGAGKTSAAARLVSVAKKSGIEAGLLSVAPVGSKALLTVQRASWLVRNPGMLAPLLHGLAQRRAPMTSNWFALRHTIVTAHALWHARLTDRTDRLVVAEEGIFQRAFLVFVGSHGVAESRLIQRFLLSSPLPDVVIVLRTAPSIAISRVRNRTQGPLSQRFDSLNDRELEEVLAAGQDSMFKAVHQVRSQRSSQINVAFLDTDNLASALDTLSPSYIHALLNGYETRED